jgi:phage-related protein
MTRRFRTLTAQFGDGYRQDTPDGLNFQIDSWNLAFENLNSTDTTAVRVFLDSVGSYTTFTWTAPGDSTQKSWKMDPAGYSVQVISGAITTISVKINQVF